MSKDNKELHQNDFRRKKRNKKINNKVGSRIRDMNKRFYQLIKQMVRIIIKLRKRKIIHNRIESIMLNILNSNREMTAIVINSLLRIIRNNNSKLNQVIMIQTNTNTKGIIQKIAINHIIAINPIIARNVMRTRILIYWILGIWIVTDQKIIPLYINN